MKAKFLMFLMAIGMLLTLPSLSYAQATDENIEFEGGDASNSEFGPVSLDEVLINGVLSHLNKTLQVNFLVDLGEVTIVIYDENGKVCLTKKVNSSKEASTVLDLKALPKQKYTVICVTVLGDQKADIEL